MLKIGDFSVLSRISIYMLRHYDEINLLKPAEVDSKTNYRYYSENQLPIANRIQALKDMGFSLRTIKEIISKCHNDSELKQYLIYQANKQRQEIVKMEERLLLIEYAVRELSNQVSSSQYSVTKKRIPERLVISYRGKIHQRSQEGDLWEKLADEVRIQELQLVSPSYNIAIFHNEEYKENDVDVEVQRVVINRKRAVEMGMLKRENEILVASLAYRGNYERLKEATEVLVKWIVANQYEISGKMFNIYHIPPENQSNPENMVTEICFPIKKRKR